MLGPRVRQLWPATLQSVESLRGGVNQELQRRAKATIEIMEDLQTYIDQRSDQLTGNTRHAILITWLVIGFGLSGIVGRRLPYRGNRSGERTGVSPG